MYLITVTVDMPAFNWRQENKVNMDKKAAPVITGRTFYYDNGRHIDRYAANYLRQIFKNCWLHNLVVVVPHTPRRLIRQRIPVHNVRVHIVDD